MQWKNRRQSSNVEDRRGRGGGGGIAIGGGAGLIIIVLALLFGADPQALLQQLGPVLEQTGQTQQGSGAVPGGVDAQGNPITDPQAELKEFVSVVLADTEDIWTAEFARHGLSYVPPKLVIFSDSVASACGHASSAVGPFYCPADANIYIDLSFMEEMGARLGAHGDFAQAYVVAHEVAHHIQHQLGFARPLDSARARGASEKEINALSVRLELQADYLAGVWAHHADRTKGVLEPGDIEEALNAASAIGDDRLQKQARGYVVPDSFTHGTSEQRVRWFRKGYESGDMHGGDSFNARTL